MKKLCKYLLNRCFFHVYEMMAYLKKIADYNWIVFHPLFLPNQPFKYYRYLPQYYTIFHIIYKCYTSTPTYPSCPSCQKRLRKVLRPKNVLAKEAGPSHAEIPGGDTFSLLKLESKGIIPPPKCHVFPSRNNNLLGQWLNFSNFLGLFSRENKPFKRLYFRVTAKWSESPSQCHSGAFFGGLISWGETWHIRFPLKGHRKTKKFA